MNYPVWELLGLGGGTLIALISVTHVYVAHLAVGGGLFIWLTDLKGYKENNALIHEFVRKHTWFFLLLTMVFGGVSGVGIWFIIALTSPAATSTLIHYFVFGWAIEWVFFLGEIVALLLYHYKFTDLKRKSRLTLAFFYFLFAWLSLVTINGIITFMLTPGKWLETQSFWDGFFNPTSLPSMFFRTFMSFMIAGIFGFLTSSFIKDNSFRISMLRYCSRWLFYSLPPFLASGLWYYLALPPSQRVVAFSLNPETRVFVSVLIGLTIVLFLCALIMSIRLPAIGQKLVSFMVIAIGLFWMGGFEYIREISRKPFVITQFMYSNSIKKSLGQKISLQGFLRSARWSKIKAINSENKVEAGRELMIFQCLSCHTVGGLHNDLIARTKGFTELGMYAALTGQGKVQRYMPPFFGTQKESQALAHYIAICLSGKKSNPPARHLYNQKSKQEIPPFDSDKDEYVLLAWNDIGMHCVSDSEPWFVILPPGNTLEAILIKRGESPEIITEGVTITYKVEPGYENPSHHVPFWKYADVVFGKQVPKNIGLKGNGLSGTLQYDEQRESFVAEGIPVVPYKDDGTYNPYPLFTIEAKDSSTGNLLAKTQVVAPVSTEMGCRNCHDGGWRVDRIAGIDKVTSTNILELHDHLEGTNLLEMARRGRPKLCQSCHSDPSLGTRGRADLLNFSAAIHGWHANYMPYDDARACVLCHPANKSGNTLCARGFHNIKGITCVDCHGNMQKHGAALLKAEATKPKARQLLANLKLSHVSSLSEIKPRRPWLQEPDCLTCHKDFDKPQKGANAFNHWNKDVSQLFRMRKGEGGIRCEACHGATHALYPAENPYSKDRDNIQPLQYSALPFPLGSNLTCKVCHMVSMEDAIHHDNMEHEFRNSEAVLGKRPHN